MNNDTYIERTFGTQEMQMILEVWQSFRRLPMWVQLWVAIWLVPVNLIGLAFVRADMAPQAGLVATLAILGMLPNIPIMGYWRGMSKAMSLPHLVFWIPLVIVLWSLMGSDRLSGGYLFYVWVLFLTNVLSLVFDIKDSIDWFRGDRAVS